MLLIDVAVSVIVVVVVIVIVVVIVVVVVIVLLFQVRLPSLLPIHHSIWAVVAVAVAVPQWRVSATVCLLVDCMPDILVEICSCFQCMDLALMRK